MNHGAQVEEFWRRYRTGLLTLLFTDIVGSTSIKQTLGAREGAALIQQHRALVRELLGPFESEEIETAGDSFFIVFAKPSDAVRFALRLQARLRAAHGSTHHLQVRIAIHIGEVVIGEYEVKEKPKDLYGIQVDACARVMALAGGDQILMTRSAFDNARGVLKGEELPGLAELRWLNHGSYVLKGLEEPLEICEVGEAGLAHLKAPADAEKAQRKVSAGEEPLFGWRPALDQLVPNTQWTLERQLGEGGFGEVWLARHRTLKERRVFKFCFRADRLRSLKRETTLFRILKERVGDHPGIVRLLEVNFDEPPFYVLMDHVEGQDLKAWCEQQGGVQCVPLPTRLEIVAQIADALQAAQDAGVIHRDVKPGNILVSAASQLNLPGVAKLTDFGIGQVVSEEALKDVTRAGFTQTLVADSSSSQTGSQMYMAPELFAGKPASTRSDIYSLGVVLYQLLVSDLTRPLTTDWAGDVSDPLLRDDLKRCFAGDPQQRFAGAGELSRSLRALPRRRARLAAREAELSARERAAYRRGILRAAVLGAAIVVAISALAAIAFRQSRIARLNELENRRLLYVSDMKLAQQALNEGSIQRAELLLEAHVPRSGAEEDLRGFEWRYLKRLSQGDWNFPSDLLDEDVLEGHADWVSSVAFSRDGRWLATGSWDHTIMLWDARTKQTTATFRGHTGGVNDVAFSPDDKLAISASDDTSIRLWDVVSRKSQPVATLVGHTAPVFALALSAASKTLASATGSHSGMAAGEVKLWDVATWQTKGEFLAHTHGVNSLALSPEGKILATGGFDGTVKLWDSNTKEMLAQFREHTGPVGALAFSLDGDTLASGSEDGKIMLWDVGTRRSLHTLGPMAAAVAGLVFAQDGKTLVGSYGDATLKLWNLATRKEVLTLEGHEGLVEDVVFSPDGRILASASSDKTVRLWPAARFLEREAVDDVNAKER